MSADSVWTLAHASRLLGEPQHRLIYLCERRVVEPDVADATGRGSSRLFSARNLLEFAIALRLRSLDLPVNTMVAIIYTLRALETRIAREVAGFELVPALRGAKSVELRAIIGDGERLYFLMKGHREGERLFGGVAIKGIQRRSSSSLSSVLGVVPVAKSGASSFAGPEASKYIRLDINITQIAKDLKLEA